MTSSAHPLSRSWSYGVRANIRSQSAFGNTKGPALSKGLSCTHVSDIVVEAAKPMLSKTFSNNRTTSALGKSLGLDQLSTKRRKNRQRLTAKLAMRQNFTSCVNAVKKSNSSQRADGLTPLKRFKKAARLVKLLITVSNACRDLLVYAIKDEQWYEFCEKFLKESSVGGTPMAKDSFLTKYKNPLTKEYVELEFDAARFKHDYHSGSELNDDIKAILSKAPGTRTSREIEEALICIKKLVPCFKMYTYDQQKLICQASMYDRYFQERVILREDLPPDGIYFVLNGTLLESGKKITPRIIKPGEKFGEEDLKVGMARKSNVVSKSSVDLLYLHKLDYIDIFELTVDLEDDEAQIFKICNDELFKYYPIKVLIKNPARWQVLKFKYGRLIANNSCDTEFVYIIRSGEARVVKQLKTREINVLQRRKKLQAELDLDDPFASKKKLLNFISENSLRPSTSSMKGSMTDRLHKISGSKRDKTISHDTYREYEQLGQKIKDKETNIEEVDEESNPSLCDEEDTELPPLPVIHKDRALMCKPLKQINGCNLGKIRPHTTPTQKVGNKRSKHKESTTTGNIDMYHQRRNSKSKNVPPFVQVDFLQAGNTYGMRSLLAPEIQGEPASLVSAGCEVIQINRKFFAKALDDNMLSIIALGAKAYPSEDELLKRLDVNLQWKEYCAEVMCGYLDTRETSLYR